MDTTGASFVLDFTPEQRSIQEMVRDYATSVIKPQVMKFDESQEFPHEIVKELAGMGCMGILVPEEYGGSGLGYTEYAIIIEELAKVDPSVALTVAAHNGLCTNHILMHANEEQKRKYLPKLASGEWVGAWGLTEPVSGSDAASMITTAVKEGNEWVLNGSKAFITHGGVGKVAVITAVSDKSKHSKGISAFIVETNTPGFIVNKKENKLGMRSSDTCQLMFDNLRVPDENLIGVEGEGFKQAMKILEGGRISIAALSVGLAEGAFREALKYSKERVQFGKPISDFQGIQFKFADMATEIEAARLMTYKAASLKDAGKPLGNSAAMAKLFASETAERCSSQAVQILGGYGFIKDFPVEKFYRDVKLTTIGEGTSEVQRIVISRSLLND
ncbi:MAG: acyl-CoA dehydrogenase [Ignavibacteriales bacterium]|nr:MAG: acyl-CoA dehydrogenase [Ignavibacteriaceae bacterium]MBW7872951.1 acyl-CoA dehydrogenase [Ignavibacteria bacterium]MCZ2142420.1 acyl-CoA dehydrogenase [Ignavibacteriales bacterium]OQY79305.1 MAG: acyl-CoA dehydrogenase [Ignavibacteriales bacterium UTCHB3]MBV6445302.1 Acyl-CoA dehydrogenase [Ignavibacteriaceae bacterium]